MSAIRETRARSVVKSVSWRLWSFVATIALVYAFTGKLRLALEIGGAEAVIKFLIFFVHERVWNRVRFGRKRIEPRVFWLTGLSGAGKTTIAEKFRDELARRGLAAELLDGDGIRALFPKTGFSREDRIEHVKRVGHLASRLEANGVFVVAALISPHREAREFVRGICENFVEVHVSTPLEVCRQRDPKGLYAKAYAGELKSFTGVSDVYEAPSSPEVEIDTSKASLDEAVRRLVACL